MCRRISLTNGSCVLKAQCLLSFLAIEFTMEGKYSFTRIVIINNGNNIIMSMFFSLFIQLLGMFKLWIFLYIEIKNPDNYRNSEYTRNSELLSVFNWKITLNLF